MSKEIAKKWFKQAQHDLEMAEKNKDIWVEKFCKEAAPVIFQAFKPSKMLIFGSRIKGNATANSDLD